jgi:hypothetical protein
MEIALTRPLEMNINFFENIETSNKFEFAHFSTSEECGRFVLFLRNNNINVKKTCCIGCGCLIPNKTRQEIKELVKRFNLDSAPLCSDTTALSTTTECGVCLKDVNSIIMVNVCVNKGHDTCVTCYTHLKSLAFSCPFCRGNLK